MGVGVLGWPADMASRVLVVLVLSAAVQSPINAQTSTVYAGTRVDVRKIGETLIGQLDAGKGIMHAGKELWRTSASSFHVFATNSTETCHFHPAETFAQVLQGEGAFRC